MGSNDGVILIGGLLLGAAVAWGAYEVASSSQNKQLIHKEKKAVKFEGPHAEIKQDIFNKVEAEQYSGAVFEACKWLFDLIRERSGIKDKDAAKLINHVFSAKNPKLKFEVFKDYEHVENAEEGFVDMLRGVAKAFRNPLAHGRIKLSKNEAMQQLNIIGYLGDVVDHKSVLVDAETVDSIRA